MIHCETSKAILGDASDGTRCSPRRAAGQAGEPQEGNGTHSRRQGQVLSPGLGMCTVLLRGTADLCVLRFLHRGLTVASLTPRGATLGKRRARSRGCAEEGRAVVLLPTFSGSVCMALSSLL